MHRFACISWQTPLQLVHEQSSWGRGGSEGVVACVRPLKNESLCPQPSHTHTGRGASKAPSRATFPFYTSLVLGRCMGHAHCQDGAPSCIPALGCGGTTAGPSIPTDPGPFCPSQRVRGWLCPPGSWVVRPPGIGE